MEINLAHGCIESEQSHADILSDNIVATAGIATSFDTRANYKYHHDNQRGVGICTMAHIADVIYQIYGVEVSEQFGYVEGKKTYDKNMYEGSSIKTMLEYARVYGLPKKSLVPTDDTTKSYADYTNVTFSKEAYDDAKNQKLPGYYKLTGVSLQDLLSEGAKSKYGLSIMIRCGTNWYIPSWANSAISPLRSGKPYTSAHATKIVTLNINKDGEIRNTWGDLNNPIIKDRPELVWADNGDIAFNFDTISPDIVEAWAFLDVPAKDVWTHTFSTSITYGQSGTEVANLQRALVKLGFLIMPTGVAYGYFGYKTANALFLYQVNRNVATLPELNRLQGHRCGDATIKQLNKDING